LNRATPRAVIYSRVSTEEQTTANQVNELTAYAERRGFSLVSIYQENDTAWKAGHQQELSRLLVAAKQGKFNYLMVWALDRLSREGALAILKLVHRLQDYGVIVISYQETWTEAGGELSDLLYALTGWVARMESNRRSERTKAGLARIKAQGKRLGRPKGSKDSRKRTRKGNIIIPMTVY